MVEAGLAAALGLPWIQSCPINDCDVHGGGESGDKEAASRGCLFSLRKKHSWALVLQQVAPNCSQAFSVRPREHFHDTI